MCSYCRMMWPATTTPQVPPPARSPHRTPCSATFRSPGFTVLVRVDGHTRQPVVALAPRRVTDEVHTVDVTEQLDVEVAHGRSSRALDIQRRRPVSTMLTVVPRRPWVILVSLQEGSPHELRSPCVAPSDSALSMSTGMSYSRWIPSAVSAAPFDRLPSASPPQDRQVHDAVTSRKTLSTYQTSCSTLLGQLRATGVRRPLTCAHPVHRSGPPGSPAQCSPAWHLLRFGDLYRGRYSGHGPPLPCSPPPLEHAASLPSLLPLVVPVVSPFMRVAAEVGMPGAEPAPDGGRSRFLHVAATTADDVRCLPAHDDDAASPAYFAPTTT